MSESIYPKSSEKNKRKPRRNSGFGCGLLTIIFICLFCAAMTAIGLVPEFVYRLPERFLPPDCDRVLLAELFENPPSTMRVTKDLYEQTRVIAVDELGQDICFFRANRSASYFPALSPNERYIAFTLNQSIADYEAVHHLFIVNTTNDSYVWFNPVNPEEHIEKLAWSPDSQTLATVSFGTSMCCVRPHTAHINLMTPSGEYIWRIDTEVRYLPSWGVLSWSEDGQQIHYEYDDADGIRMRIGSPFWCTINRDGTDLQCEFSNR